MSRFTYTCAKCGDTSEEVLEVINDENVCSDCKSGGER